MTKPQRAVLRRATGLISRQADLECGVSSQGANCTIDPYVQRWVAGTNGRLYQGLIGKLPRYPIPVWPGPVPVTTSALLLDVGCAWGRWMISSADVGFTPIGIDVRIEALEAARRVLKTHGRTGFVVAADLKSLPFKPEIFDAVFSYSVLQHVHRSRAAMCLREVHRVLASDGSCMIEFPVSHGLGNMLRRLPGREEEEDYESWCVRYYSLTELERRFRRIFGNCEFISDCYFGIGLQRADLDMLPLRYKTIVALSEGLKLLSSVIRPLRCLADSIYVAARKACTGTSRQDHARIRFNPNAKNLDILPYLQCPQTGGELLLSAAGDEIICKEARIAYPVVDEIPILIPDRSRNL